MNRMLSKNFLCGALMACLAVAAILPIHADEVKKDKEQEAEDAFVQVMSNLQLADGLIYYGRANKTPEALVTAALILHRNPTETVKGEKDYSPTPKALLEEARAMRKDDKSLSAVIDNAADTLKEAARGAGPTVHKQTAKLTPKTKLHTFSVPIPLAVKKVTKQTTVTVLATKNGKHKKITVTVKVGKKIIATKTATGPVTIPVPHNQIPEGSSPSVDVAWADSSDDEVASSTDVSAFSTQL